MSPRPMAFGKKAFGKNLKNPTFNWMWNFRSICDLPEEKFLLCLDSIGLSQASKHQTAESILNLIRYA
jgi:hypothetical protein